MRGAGHRFLPHTADLRLEAWAPTRDACLAEAVMGLVEGFADLSGTGPPYREWGLTPVGGADEDVLVSVLEEVIYLLDTEGAVPARVETRWGGHGSLLCLHLVPLHRVEPVGAAPKAVTLDGLRFGPDSEGWSCEATVDV